jgi:predicted amidohydrolase
MRIALAQLNPLVGDLAGNAARLLRAAVEAAVETDSGEPLLMVTPELSLWGYPARDLLLRPSLVALQNRLLDQLVSDLQRQAPQVSLLVGIAEPTGSGTVPNLHNALALVEAGGWRLVYRKQLLPSYDVFDERRYFVAGTAPAVLQWPPAGGLRLGLTICEDLWVDADLPASAWTVPTRSLSCRTPASICCSISRLRHLDWANWHYAGSWRPGRQPGWGSRSCTSTRWAATMNWCSTGRAS